MGEFPEFMRNPANRIAAETQYTKGIEGYVFDGADGSQMAFWTTLHGGVSAEHTHPYDEYFVVVEGRYTVITGEGRVPVGVGEECLIPRGTPHSGESLPGTRTIHAFGGRRAKRVGQNLRNCLSIPPVQK
jgi:mannose-6-phosphate isomerase-like protein (cupin superfamily)